MLYSVLLLLFIIYSYVESSEKDRLSDDNDLGLKLVASLRNDANLDLSVDDEYEDLRAELLAYHTALASLTSSRRSLMTTPCWTLGGICVNFKLCSGFRYLTEVPGCKDKLNVCCFTWNRFKVRDMRDKGLGTLTMPWSLKYEFGGKGVIEKAPKKKKIKRRVNKMKTNNSTEPLVLIIKTNDN